MTLQFSCQYGRASSLGSQDNVIGPANPLRKIGPR